MRRGEMGRGGDEEIGRLGEGEMRRLGDGEMGRLGEWENCPIPNSQFPIPNSLNIHPLNPLNPLNPVHCSLPNFPLPPD